VRSSVYSVLNDLLFISRKFEADSETQGSGPQKWESEFILASLSASSFPLMSQWPGTQHNHPLLLLESACSIEVKTKLYMKIEQTTQPCYQNISAITRQLLQFSARPSSIPLKIGIMRVFSKKQITIFLISQKASHKKTLGLPTVRYPRFLHHTFFDNSTSFYCKNLCFGALERLFIDKIKKKKTNKNNFFRHFFWFRWLEVELLKMQFFKNLKKWQLNTNYMMYVRSKSFVVYARVGKSLFCNHWRVMTDIQIV
jgi:hypothetical protein